MLTPVDATSSFSGFKVLACRLSAADRIPDKPGVYAFYRQLVFSPQDPAASLKRLVGSINHKPYCEIELPWRITIDLLSRPANLESTMASAIERREEAHIMQLVETLFKFSILTRPWYVGSTSNLRRRFKEHLETGFLRMMEKELYGLQREDFLFLAYPTRADITDDLESLFIQLGNPLFNIQRK